MKFSNNWGLLRSLWKRGLRKYVKNGLLEYWIKDDSFNELCWKFVNPTACVLKPWRLSRLEVGGDGYGQGRLSSGRPGERACGLCEGLAGALLEVKCKLWVNDLIPIIPMCTFCNTSLVCVEKREGIFYGCSSSTSGRRLSVLNALRKGSTLQGDFYPLQAGSELGWSVLD